MGWERVSGGSKTASWLRSASWGYPRTRWCAPLSLLAILRHKQAVARSEPTPASPYLSLCTRRGISPVAWKSRGPFHRRGRGERGRYLNRSSALRRLGCRAQYFDNVSRMLTCEAVGAAFQHGGGHLPDA